MGGWAGSCTSACCPGELTFPAVSAADVVAVTGVAPEEALLLSLPGQPATSTTQANMLIGRTSGRRIASMR